MFNINALILSNQMPVVQSAIVLARGDRLCFTVVCAKTVVGTKDPTLLPGAARRLETGTYFCFATEIERVSSGGSTPHTRTAGILGPQTGVPEVGTRGDQVPLLAGLTCYITEDPHKAYMLAMFQQTLSVHLQPVVSPIHAILWEWDASAVHGRMVAVPLHSIRTVRLSLKEAGGFLGGGDCVNALRAAWNAHLRANGPCQMAMLQFHSASRFPLVKVTAPLCPELGAEIVIDAAEWLLACAGRCHTASGTAPAKQHHRCD